jgi:hypothetical protein
MAFFVVNANSYLQDLPSASDTQIFVNFMLNGKPVGATGVHIG